LPLLALNMLDKLAAELGIDLIGAARAEPLENEALRLKNWLAKEFHGEMAYMEKYQDLRQDLNLLHPGSRSVIMIGMNYYGEIQRGATSPKISRYVTEKDYHRVLKMKLQSLLERLQKIDSSITGQIFTDSAPVFEKSWAVRAGLGWIGKNTCLINPQFGSWLFLGGIASNLAFDSYSRAMPERCGKCTRCLNSCPTRAFPLPFQLDARRCISYLSIEDRSPDFSQEIKLFGWLYGCDICQENCPWNMRFAKISANPELQPAKEIHSLTFSEWESRSHNQLKKIMKPTAMTRQRLPLLKRNLKIILEET